MRVGSADSFAYMLDGTLTISTAGAARMGEGSRCVGAFRACGIAIPVFEIPDGVGPEEVADDAASAVATESTQSRPQRRTAASDNSWRIKAFEPAALTCVPSSSHSAANSG